LGLTNIGCAREIFVATSIVRGAGQWRVVSEKRRKKAVGLRTREGAGVSTQDKVDTHTSSFNSLREKV
jgi:hypothetical protein